jgi:hypothetical protein
MPGLSKSKYTNFRKCPKCLWLGTYKPKEQVIDPSTQARFDAGTIVGDLAKGLFGPYTDVTTKTPDGKPDTKVMQARTQQCLNDGTENICEAAFSYQGCYCAVDILRKTDNGYAIYEVKSSTSADKEVYAQDVALQKWVLTQCGLRVTGTYLVCLNKQYVRQGAVDIQQLFSINDISQAVEEEYPKVADNVKEAIAVLSNTDEPDITLGDYCHKPYGCGFMSYCMRQCGIPDNEPTVFDLYRGLFDKQLEHVHNGIVTFPDIVRSGIHLTPMQKIQVDCTTQGTTHIDKAALREFLSTLDYPIYHLDFETMQPAVPPFDGTHPFQQIPFQYSLHIEHADGRLEHREFLGDSVNDPRRALAEQLCRDIPQNACVTAYNKKFECDRLNELAKAFPDLSAHLSNISDHIIDLLPPFQSGYCYYPAMGGGFSIKAVLPALFPNDPELDYHNLEGSVHNGGEAMDIYPRIADMLPDEQASVRESLLRYCELDTYAMVKVLAKLRELAR